MIRQCKILPAAIIVTSVFVLAACSSDNDSTPVSTLNWKSCESASQLQCTELLVPMDYRNTDGEKITLSLIRKPASGAQRKGSLMFNPGGPGGSGIELIKAFEQLDSIPSGIPDSYDLVSFDPRGVGESTPVDCTESGIGESNGYPVDENAIREMHAEISGSSAACSQQVGAYLQQLGSLNVVRDMERIRIALAEDKLDFIGYSYGTRLAALYLQEYPTSSGRIVLDASIHPDSSIIRLMKDTLFARQSGLRMLLSLCTQADASCDVDQLMEKLLQRVNDLATDESAGDEFELFGEIIVAATEEPDIAAIAAAPVINYINTGDFSALVQFVINLDDDENDSSDDEEEDSTTVEIAVLCADDAHRPTEASLIELAAEFNLISDVFAENIVSQTAECAGWPEALEPLAPIGTGTAPLSLVIGGTTDTNTPLAWSEAMAQAIGGVFIRSEHKGHTSVFNGESECIDNLVEQFLMDGLTPATTECGLEEDN